ncbi:hypothetical protein C0583_05090 [Candidatus Parcubacteria bacterium]|nr:MAG: hypothetical protein C0583_05090 [Candidatus Parcubacteria bacterium]
MIKKTVKHIHKWRLGFLLLFSVVFLSYLGLNPIDLSKYFGASFSSAIGMSVGVPDNPYNKLASQLKEKEEMLNARENALNEREASIGGTLSDETLIMIMGSGIILLFLLIIINYYLDFRRNKKQRR